MTQITDNFNLQEFRSKDGAVVPSSLVRNAILLALNLQVIRNELNKDVKPGGPQIGLIVQSGYRSPAHNKAVGGALESTHLTAEAADLRSNQRTPKQIGEVIEKLHKAGKIVDGGFKVYPTFVHYDISRRRRW